jgi:FkbM family methyltransferase
VLALEPSVREYKRLLSNLQFNKITNVEAVRAAASRVKGTCRLRIAEARHAGHNTLGSFIYETGMLREEEVPTVPLDALAVEHGIARVDVIKIDVEGAEHAVLDGARNIIGRDHPVLLVEVIDGALQRQGSSQEALLDLLQGWGYELYAFDQGSGRPVRAVEPSEQDPNMIAIHPGNSVPVSQSAGGR